MTTESSIIRVHNRSPTTKQHAIVRIQLKFGRMSYVSRENRARQRRCTVSTTSCCHYVTNANTASSLRYRSAGKVLIWALDAARIPTIQRRPRLDRGRWGRRRVTDALSERREDCRRKLSDVIMTDSSPCETCIYSRIPPYHLFRNGADKVQGLTEPMQAFMDSRNIRTLNRLTALFSTVDYPGHDLDVMVWFNLYCVTMWHCNFFVFFVICTMCATFILIYK